MAICWLIGITIIVSRKAKYEEVLINPLWHNDSLFTWLTTRGNSFGFQSSQKCTNFKTMDRKIFQSANPRFKVHALKEQIHILFQGNTSRNI